MEKLKKVAGNEARNMVVNVAVIKNLVVVKCPQVAVVFARSGSEGLQGSGNTGHDMQRSIPLILEISTVHC